MTVHLGMLPHWVSYFHSFNCLLPAFQCQQFSECDEYNGKCKCPPGFGGDDCLQPGIPLKRR
jgi:hypothetical protein